MEYRGIRYTVRARIERNEWTVSIHPADIESPRRLVTGSREDAELLARSMIDKWHQARGANRREGAVNFTLNSSFTEAVQGDSTRRDLSLVWMGKAVKSIAIVSRRGVYEAIALAVFAGMVVLFVHAIVPLIAD